MMNKLAIIIILSLSFTQLYSQTEFNKYFENASLRVDYMCCGDADNINIYINEMKKQPHWGGSDVNMIDTFDYGIYQYCVFDKASKKLIYSRGFSSLFFEWQSTAEAKNITKSFYQVANMPFPKNEIIFEIYERDAKDEYQKIFSQNIDPKNYMIIREEPKPCNTTKYIYNGSSAKHVDIAVIAEGYTAEEMDKFRADAKRCIDYMFNFPPYDKYKNKFNIWLVEAESEESGVDIPGQDIYVNSALSSTYYTFGVSRYLMQTDMKAANDYAANVPFDQLYVLVNSETYGGGGIFNYLNITAAGASLADQVFIHELGHGFIGLADEYYSSEVAYSDFYDLSLEPWEPNITTMVDFDSKWKGLMKKKTPVPTPRTKKYENTLGVFEGGGYVSKGIYSPMQDCRMKTNEAKSFCPACQKAIIDMIKFYSE